MFSKPCLVNLLLSILYRTHITPASALFAKTKVIFWERNIVLFWKYNIRPLQIHTDHPDQSCKFLLKFPLVLKRAKWAYWIIYWYFLQWRCINRGPRRGKTNFKKAGCFAIIVLQMYRYYKSVWLWYFLIILTYLLVHVRNKDKDQQAEFYSLLSVYVN